MTVLITGASGNVGSELFVELEKKHPEWEVRKGSARPRKDPDWVEFDFCRPETFALALAGVDKIFLMRPPNLADVQKHFVPFLDFVSQTTAISSLVFLSIQGAEKMPWVPHRKIEIEIQKRGLPWTILRPSFFFQNLSGTHRRELCETGQILLPAGKGRTSFVDTRDVAEAAAGILSDHVGHLYKEYELTGLEALDYEEVVAGLGLACGRALFYRPVGMVAFYRHCRKQKLPPTQAFVMTVLYSLCRMGQAAHTTNELKMLLGRGPRNLSDFAIDYAQCWME